MKYRTFDKKHIVFMMSFLALLICRPLAYMLMQMKPASTLQTVVKWLTALLAKMIMKEPYRTMKAHADLMTA